MTTTPSFGPEGRHALVTGASRGLGRAIAHALAAAGAEIAVCGRDWDGLAETCRAVAPGKCIAVQHDVTEVSRTTDMVREIASVLGGLDILVNNAGVEEVRPSLDVDEALWDRIVATNLKGAFFAAQAAAPVMRGAGGGAIVNLCSLTSYVGVPTAVPYGASKTGLLGITRALAAEWAADGIRVNAVAPGYVRTAMTEGFYADAAWQERVLARIPQRRFGRPEDVGGAVVFLCSDAAAYVTGHCIPIDGGFLAAI